MELPEEVQAAYDAANELIRFNSSTPNLSYDANGNLLSQTDTNGTTTYTWDARNRLTGISGPNLAASFVYDALGRRISKTINSARTDYRYDGNDIIAEIKGGAVAATYLRSLNIDEPFLRSSAIAEYYHADALGSVMVLTDQTGAVTTSYAYEAFGKTTVSGASANPFQYTGRENDGTGLYYYRARYYSPTLQRFISEDPIGFFDDMNLYTYVGNNPLKWIDPSGLGKWDKLYGLPKKFWHWLHREEGGKLIKELKDPTTKQVPKDVAEEYYKEWKRNQRGSVDPELLLDLLKPLWLTLLEGELDAPACEMPGSPPCRKDDDMDGRK